MKTNKSGLISLILLLMVSFAPSAMGALTPGQVLDKTASILKKAGTLECSFTLKADGGNMPGTLKTKGKKFSILTSVTSSWYNGTDLWTYSQTSGETTLIKPTQSELAETNPLLYVDGYASSFKASFAPKQTKGKYTVVLTPLKSGTGISSVVLVIDSSTFKPTTIMVHQKSGKGNITLSVKNLKTGGSVRDSDFVYPASKYKNVKIVDLR